MQKLDGILHWLPVIVLGITPLFFFPAASDYYDFNKWALLAMSALILLFLFGLRLALTGKLEVHWSPASAGLLALTAASGASTLVVSANKAEAAVNPMGVVTFACLFLLTLFVPSSDKKVKTLLLWFLSAGAGVAGLVAIYGALGLGKAFGDLPFLANPLWSPLGGSIPLLAYLVVTVPLSVGHFIRSLKAKEEVEAAIAAGISAVSVAGIAVTLWQLTKQPIQLLPLWANWSVLLETIKQPLHLAFGVGPENFLAAFASGRPAALNTSPVWDIRFSAGSSFLLHTATTLGIAGVVALLFFLRSFLLPNLSLVLSLLVLLFLPPSLPIFVATISLVLLTSQTSKKFSILPFGFAQGKHSPFSIPAGSAIIIFSFFGLYLLGRVYLADVAFARAVAALDKNDGSATYAALVTAVSRNPFPPRYHATLSQTSLALASAILNKTNDAKQPLSPGDKQLVTDLYQQAIREGKTAIARAPGSVLVWENLASVYRSFIGVAAGSENWAIATVSQAVALDPTNPLLRIQLGGLLLRTNRIDEAISGFQSAVALKDDLANAHYNLAHALREKGDYLLAAVEFRKTGSLVSPGSSDADRVAADFAEVVAKLSTEESSRLSQTPIQPPAASREEILSPVGEFSPIPTPTLTISQE